MTSRRTVAPDKAEVIRQAAAIVNALERSHDTSCPCHGTARAGYGKTHCPCIDEHKQDDAHPSLVVNISDNGKKVLWHCQVGCKQEAVTAALTSMGLSIPAAGTAPIKAWDILDVDGKLLAKHLRRNRADGKEMWWAQADGTKGLNGSVAAKDLLYGSELLKQRPDDMVVITEGEQAADALISRGFLALGTFGAGIVPSLQALSPLKGRTVKLWPDNDDPGRVHMDGIGKVLGQLGIVPSVVGWVDAPYKGDAADFVGDADAVRVLLDAATPWKPAEEAPGAFGRLASDFKMRRIEWLWPGRLALGMLAGMDGDPSLGKSTLLADMAAHITTGRDWPDGTRCPVGGAIIVAAEDSVEQVWVPRLKAAGADLEKVLIIGIMTGTDGKPRLPSLPEDVALFEKAIIDRGAKLIGFDPIMPYLSKTANANSDKDVRQCLTPLADMLDRVNCCGLMLRHFAKSDKVANALYRGLGSIAFNGLARTAMAVSKVPTETGSDVPESMSLMVTKNNVGIKPRSRRYQIEAVDLGGGIVTSRIAWGDASNDRPDDLLTEAGRATKPGEQAQDFLRTVLADGPRLATEVEALAEAEGITKITLSRARVKLRIASAPTDFKGPWTMQLPPEI